MHPPWQINKILTGTSQHKLKIYFHCEIKQIKINRILLEARR